ncbi:MAG: asparagine synthetase B, partial [Oligoflexia bacterium]|nr:asparagine synthetase B [Oligoflexia bacterium]
EFCFSITNKYKIRNGIGKWLLREAMKGILPEKVRTRKDKAGFIAPADEWFRTVNKNHLYQIINDDLNYKKEMFNKEKLNRIFTEHIEEKSNHYMFLWQLINIHEWRMAI